MQHCAYTVTLRHVRESLMPWKIKSILYFRVRACVRAIGRVNARARVALLIHHATRMRHIVTSFVAPLALPYFSTLSHKRHDFRKNNIEHKMCVLIFYTNFVYNISHSKKKKADTVINVKTPSCEVPVIPVGF